MCNNEQDNSSMDHSNMNCNTRDRNTRDHRTKDRSNMCVNNTSNGHQSNGPSRLCQTAGHPRMRSRDVRSDGSGTDGGSGNNPQRRRCNPRHMNRHRHIHISSLRCWDQSRRLYHVYIRWEHRPILNRPHTGSGWFRRYNGGYTHRDHGPL